MSFYERDSDERARFIAGVRAVVLGRSGGQCVD